MPRPYSQVCPIARTLDILGDRWTLLIVRDLFFGNARFNDFLRSSPGLPPKVLSDRLKRLEEEGLVQRSIYSEYPPRAEYHLTEKGRSLQPVLMAIGRWGLEHCFEDEPETREAVRRAVFDAVGESLLSEESG